MSKVTPFLWFDKDMNGIIEYYKSIFPDLVTGYVNTTPDTPSGTVQIANVEIFGQKLTFMTAGPLFKFNEAFSLVIDCEDQNEVDYYWDKMTKEGEESQCGWLKDKYGLSWQIVPKRLNELMVSKDREKAAKATQAMLKMKKIVISELEEAYNS